MKNIFYFLVFAVVVFSSCEKGEKGDAGPQGLAGTNGTNGAANVSVGIYDLTWSGTYPLFTDTLNILQITDSINDVVMVYCQKVSGGDWYALPASDFGCVGSIFSYSYNIGVVNIYYNSSSCSPISTWKLKVVVIHS